MRKLHALIRLKRKLAFKFAFACATYTFLIIEANSPTNLLFFREKLVQNKVYRKLFARRLLIELLGSWNHRPKILIEKLYRTI